jgi:hypothetical protein
MQFDIREDYDRTTRPLTNSPTIVRDNSGDAANTEVLRRRRGFQFHGNYSHSQLMLGYKIIPGIGSGRTNLSGSCQKCTTCT